MADLSDINSAESVKIIGSDATGVEQTPVQSTSNGGLHTNLRDNAGTELATVTNPARIDPTGTTSQPVVGNVASASTDSGNPIKVGGIYNSTRPTLTNSQRGDIQIDTRGALVITSEDVDPANQNITTQDVASSTSTGANQQIIITGTPTANSAATFTLSSDQSVVVQASGTWTGTLQTEISMDGGTSWFIRPIHQTGTLFTFSSFTANFTGGGNTSGYTTFRVRATSAITGTAVINLIQTDNVNTVYIGNIVQNAPIDGIKQTYSAAIVGLVAAATPTDIFTITGSATKTIRINKIDFSGTQNTSASRDILLIKRSTANSGGTSTTLTAVPHDSNNSAATATVRAYTANPTLGSTVGTIRSKRIQLLATNVSNPLDSAIWDFGNRPSQSIVLRGTGDVLAINLNSITSSNNLLEISIEWSEE